MIEHDALDAERLLVEQRAGRQWRRWKLAQPERLAGAELAGADDAMFGEFFRGQHEIERLLVEQIPGIAAELVGHPLDEAGRTDEVKRGGAMQADPQQAIEAGEMIHVGVGHEHVGETQELARRQRRQLAEVEQQGPPPEAEIDEQPRIRNGSLTRRGCTSQVTSIPFVLLGRRRDRAWDCDIRGHRWSHGARQKTRASGFRRGALSVPRFDFSNIAPTYMTHADGRLVQAPGSSGHPPSSKFLRAVHGVGVWRFGR